MEKIGKIFRLLFISLLLMGAGISERKNEPFYHPQSSVKRVMCREGSGTAFLIRPSTYVSADHVTQMTDCQVDDQNINLTFTSPEQDFSVFTVNDATGKPLKINCDGFHPGERYQSIGYPGDQKYVTNLQATRYSGRVVLDLKVRPKMRLLIGAIFHGMSGGPIINSGGEVVGINNAESLHETIGLSQELRDTHLCVK